MLGRGRGRRGGGRGRRGGGGGRGRQAYEQGAGRGRGGARGAGSAGNQPSVVASTSQPPWDRPRSPAVASSSSHSRDLKQESTQDSSPAPDRSVPSAQSRTPVQSPTSCAPDQKAVQLSPASSKALKIPARPQPVRLPKHEHGEKCTVLANHFLVYVEDNKDPNIYHYDVSITPKDKSELKISKKLCRKIVKELSNSQLDYKLAYDGNKNIYTAKPLPLKSDDFEISLEWGSKVLEFKVNLKKARETKISDLLESLKSDQFQQQTIQALDVVLRTEPSANYQVLGRSFFDPVFNLGTAEASGGLEYWKGYCQSIRPTQMGLSLNIDVSARAFYEPILASDFADKYLTNNRQIGRPLTNGERIKLEKALIGVRVKVQRKDQEKCYRVKGVSTSPTNNLKFVHGQEVKKVKDHIEENYEIRLCRAYLPAINTGSDEKPTYFPMEICTIVEGQHYSKNLNETQVKALLIATCQIPGERKESITNVVVNNNYKKDQYLEDFKLKVTPHLTEIEARVLPTPTLEYRDENGDKSLGFTPKEGRWNMDRKRMVIGGNMEFWSFVNFSRNVKAATLFLTKLKQTCIEKGMNVRDPLHEEKKGRPGDIEKTLTDTAEKSANRLRQMGHEDKDLQLLIIILPDDRGKYGKIKRVCETKLGIVSQCCQPQKVEQKWNSIQFLVNVALKINVKVGGKNVMLEENKSKSDADPIKTIIFGADVTHPQPGDYSSPSIAAVVASTDWPQPTNYRAAVKSQAPRKEIIEDLGSMVREHLTAFKNANGCDPQRMLFYRDGVSEGQFNQVLEQEVKAIREVCDKNMKLTFVVVQKRHHTRLFPKEKNVDKGKKNIPPGTVVDTMICHPWQFDFYLCSHHGTMGTSRPTHYHVLCDDNEFTSNQLQTLTNDLCYTYARCTRSVSVVPPAYYAHLAAFRARYYIEDDKEASSSGEGDVVRHLPEIKDDVKKVMFYC